MAATEKLFGRVADYHSHLHVGIVEITATGGAVGDQVHVMGRHTDFIQSVESRQLDRMEASHADIGKSVGMSALEKVREHDRVYWV